MLIVKTNPVGIDAAIQDVQAQLHASLLSKWAINTNTWNCYGRAYRNKKDKGYIAEVYQGNKQYKEVYWNDELSVVSFFGINNRPIDQLNTHADIHMIFFVDLDKLELKDSDGDLVEHRADEEVRRDVFRSIDYTAFGMTYISTELGLENILKEYPGLRRDNLETKVDMHPVHAFRINYSLAFEDTDCYNKPLNNF